MKGKKNGSTRKASPTKKCPVRERDTAKKWATKLAQFSANGPSLTFPSQRGQRNYVKKKKKKKRFRRYNHEQKKDGHGGRGQSGKEIKIQASLL